MGKEEATVVTASPAAVAAAAWWSDALHRYADELTDKRLQDQAARAASGQEPYDYGEGDWAAPPKSSEIERFQAELAAAVDAAFEAGYPVLMELRGQPTLCLSSDSLPNLFITEIAERCGLHCEAYIFPMYAAMWVTRDKITLRYGTDDEKVLYEA